MRRTDIKLFLQFILVIMNGMSCLLILKNAPSEFQNIMNDIFTPFIDFSIVYIDDVLIFSKTIDDHWKHLDIFVKVIKHNGLVVLATKINLFKDKI